MAFLVLIVFLFGVFFTEKSLAQTDQGTGAIVATVNIYNAQIVSQEGNTFNISFDLSNRVGVQSGVKYSASLTKSPDNNTVDQKVYDETLVLGENQTISKNISYTPSASLSGGNYQLWIKSANDRGLILALGNPGTVTITGTNAPKVEILSDTCYLTVDNEKPIKQYIPRQGVDIADTESLTATCKVLSIFPTDTSFTPKFETYFRSVYGNKVSQTGGTATPISIKTGTSSVSVSLPKATAPQSYDVLFSLVSLDQLTVSNSANFHYVLRGASGTIQNTVFDKSSYQKDETANLQIFFSPSADTFQDSRLGSGTNLAKQKLDVVVTDKNGSTCGTFTKEMTPDDKPVFNALIQMTRDCENPIAKITLSGAKDVNSAFQALDSRDFQTPIPPAPASPLDSKAIIIFISILGLLIIISAIYTYVNKKGY